MNPPLLELQAKLARGVVSGDFGPVIDAMVPDPPGAAARLQIYHNHYRVSLIEAVGASFPVVLRLLGEDFFRQVARAFVMSHPPQAACLHEYGAGFPRFMSSVPETAALPYLEDVARLEWALNEAWFAPDAEPADVAALSALPPGDLLALRPAMHPCCRLVASAYPIDRIWCVNQQHAADEIVDLASGSVRLLVYRDADDARWRCLNEAAFAFVAGLMNGASLRAAAEAAHATGAPFDVASLLTEFVAARLFVRTGESDDFPGGKGAGP